MRDRPHPSRPGQASRGLDTVRASCRSFHSLLSGFGVRFTEAENVAVRILDVKIEACPRPFFEWSDHSSPTPFQLAEQTSDAGHGNVRVQMFVVFPVFSVRRQFRRIFEMDRESVTGDGCIECLILEVELEAEPVTVVPNRPIKIVDEKLRCDPGHLRSSVNWHGGHLTPRSQRAFRTSGGSRRNPPAPLSPCFAARRPRPPPPTRARRASPFAAPRRRTTPPSPRCRSRRSPRHTAAAPCPPG